MKLTNILLVLVFVASLILTTGCVSQDQYDDLKLKNRTQEERIADLESQLSALTMQYKQISAELEKARELGSVDEKYLQEELTAIEKALEQKNALIARMQAQLAKGGAPLPMELNVMLTDFADKNNGLVSFDQTTGMLKFKSDLIFTPGSDKVQPDAVKALGSLAEIVKTSQAEDFDITVAGHTDDMRISKPSTKAKHPTNWHLSTNRAISVLKVLESNGITSTRLSARGFGEFRPVEPNKAKKKGNPANRRVEIFIVPKGM